MECYTCKVSFELNDEVTSTEHGLVHYDCYTEYLQDLYPAFPIVFKEWNDET